MNAEITGARVYWESDFTLPLFGHISITETMVNAWVVMLIILGLCLFFTHNLQKIPKGKQALIEKAIEMVDGLIEQNMGCQSYAPYIVTLLLSSVLGSLVSLIGLRSVTADLNTTLGWAIMTFCMIIYANIRYKGLGGYLKGFLEPIPVMLPLNILSEIATPVSMSFRHFGNIAGGMVITTLLMGALSALSTALHLPIPLLQIGIPGVLSLYFDLFSGCIQAFIFSMLTMAYVGSAREA
mgnify:CR=1 FL=1